METALKEKQETQVKSFENTWLFERTIESYQGLAKLCSRLGGICQEIQIPFDKELLMRFIYEGAQTIETIYRQKFEGEISKFNAPGIRKLLEEGSSLDPGFTNQLNLLHSAIASCRERANLRLKIHLSPELLDVDKDGNVFLPVKSEKLILKQDCTFTPSTDHERNVLGLAEKIVSSLNELVEAIKSTGSDVNFYDLLDDRNGIITTSDKGTAAVDYWSLKGI